MKFQTISGTKIDIWALGVMFYRLCYFILPFGESSLAIQNCSYTFPDKPKYPEGLRAIISKSLLSLRLRKLRKMRPENTDEPPSDTHFLPNMTLLSLII